MPPPSSYHEDLSIADSRVLRTGLSVLFRGAWDHKRTFAWSFFFGIAFALLQVYSAKVLGDVTENLIVPAFTEGRPAFATIVTGASAVFAVAVFRAVAVAGRRVFAAFTQFSLYADYRHRLNRQYTDLPLAWHRRHPTGQLLSNVNADVEAMWFVMAPFPFALGTVAMLVYALISIVAADVWLGLVAIILIPTIIAINVIYQRIASPLVTRGQQFRAEVSQVAHESFDGAAVVKALGREQQETERFADASHRLRDAIIRVGYVRGWFDPMMDALPERRSDRGHRGGGLADQGRRHRHRHAHPGHLPPDADGAPVALDRLGPRRPASTRRRLGPGAEGARGDRRSRLRVEGDDRRRTGSGGLRRRRLPLSGRRRLHGRPADRTRATGSRPSSSMA